MLKVGLVGCGFMGRMHGNVYKMLDGVELVACADKGGDRRDAYASQFGIPSYDSIEELHAAHQVDVIDICAPTISHKDLTLRAAALGVHVCCEKPMALSLEEADAMIAACDSAGVSLFIAHCIRFWPEYARLKELHDSGELGQLLSINLTRYGGFPLWATDQWSWTEQVCGGGVLDMHIHDMDYILYLLGEPDTMDAWGTIDERGPSHAFTTLTYGNTIAHLEGGWNLPPGSPFKMAFRAIFEKAAVIWDASPMTIYEQDKEPRVQEFVKMEASGGGNLSDLGGYAAELSYFTTCLKEGRKPEIVTPQSSRLTLEYGLKEIAQIRAKQVAK
jgi:predicted dehydrogenase